MNPVNHHHTTPEPGKPGPLSSLTNWRTLTILPSEVNMAAQRGHDSEVTHEVACADDTHWDTRFRTPSLCTVVPMDIGQ